MRPYREGRRHNHFVGHQTVHRGRYGDGGSRQRETSTYTTKSRSRSRSLSPLGGALVGGGSPVAGRSRYVHMDMAEGRHTLEDRMGDGPSLGSSTTLMSFRQFVMSQMDDEPDENPLSAVEMYERYKSVVIQKAAKKYFSKNKSSGYMLETYHPDFIRKMQQQEALEAVQRADVFIKQWRHGLFKDAKLVSSPRLRNYEGGKLYYEKVDYAVPADSIASLAIQSPPSQSTGSPADTTGTAPYFTVDMNALCLKLHHVSARLSYWDLKDAVEKLEGVCDISLSKPSQSTMFKERSGWLKFNSQTSRYSALSTLGRTRVKEGHLFLQPSLEYSQPLGGQRLHILPLAMSAKERITKDVRMSAALIRKYDREYGVIGPYVGASAKVDEDAPVTSTGAGDTATSAENPIFKREEEDCAMGAVVPDTDDASQLDLQLLYLQKVHKINYYAGMCFNTQRALWQSVGAGYVRSYVADVVNLEDDGTRAATGTGTGTDSSTGTGTGIDVDDKSRVQNEMLTQALKAEDNTWIDDLDYKLGLLLEAKRVDPPAISSEHPAVVSRWKDFCEENTSSVDTAKWKCAICKKMFKGAEFVHKHLKNKHSTSLDKIISSVLESVMEDSYLSDPNKIVPVTGASLTDRRQPFHRHTSGGNQDEKFDFDKPRQRYSSDAGRYGHRHSETDRHWGGDLPVDSTGGLLHQRERLSVSSGGFSNTGTYVDRDNPPVDISMPLVVPSEVRATVRYDDL